MSFDGPHYEVYKELNLGQPINGYQITKIYEEWPQKIKVVAIEITENKRVIIEFNKLIDSQTEQIKKAASIYQLIDHPNIVKVEKIFIYKEYLCLVFSFILHEDVAFLLNTSFPKGMPEYFAGKIIYQMLDALRYIHSLGICHNNITCDNILLLQEQKLFILSDFTHSFTSSSKCIFSEISEYSAPEKIKHEPFNISSDMWSLGVSLFVMLSGQLPFPSYFSNQQECIEAILSGHLNYQLLVDAGVSEGAINLIQSLCKVDPHQRNTAEEAITNEWVIKNGKENESEEYFSKLEKALKKSEMNEVETGGNPLPNENKMKYGNNATCSACMKEFDKEKEGVYVLPDMFLCREDFDRFQNGTLPKEIIDEYNIKHAKNSIIELFTPIIVDNNIDTSNYPPEEVFIDSEMISTAQFLSKFSKYFVPTATFHLPIQPEEINIKEIIALFPSEVKIVSIERGSTFLTVAFIITDKLQRTKEKYQQLINRINEKLIVWGGPIMGKTIEEPQINIPNKEDISNTIVNFIQHTEIVNQINFDDIIEEVQQMISEQSNKDWEFILKHKKLYDEAEKQVRKDIYENRFEMIITGQTIITSKFYKKYKETKKQIEDQIKKEKYALRKKQNGGKYELYLYHGTKFSNHPRIARKHFLMPGDKKYKPTDKGFFGRGIYATENIFYASMYGNLLHQMNYKDKASVFFCQSIFNPNHVEVITPEDGDRFEGQTLSEVLTNNHGIHRILVGDANNDFHAIKENEKDESKLIATEFVFPNKYQIVPICSFNVMRTEFYILWADENEKYREYSNKLKENIIYNVYYSGNIDELGKIVQTKFLNNIKLIVSYDNDEWASIVIEGVRSFYECDVVCLIFSEDQSQIEFATTIQDTIFTNKFEDLLGFTKLSKNKDEVIKFAQNLENENTKFKLTKSENPDFKDLNFKLKQDNE